MTRKVDRIYIHQSGFPYGTTKATKEYHLSKGWDDIGYHFVIENGYSSGTSYKYDDRLDELDGATSVGRNIDIPGAHVQGDNETSIGIMLIGDSWDGMTKKQMDSLIKLVKWLVAKYNIDIENVMGHFETKKVPTEKSCPFSEDERYLAASGMEVFRKLIAAQIVKDSVV